MADLFILGVAPIDYSPILLLKPFGFRIAPDTLSSSGKLSVGRRGITPAFGYSAPGPVALELASFEGLALRMPGG